MRIVFVVLGGLTLAGCFEAEAPLFAESRGDCPFKDATPMREFDGDGKPREAVNTFSTDGAYCAVTNEKGETDRVLFVPIGDNWYILQDETGGQAYVMARVRWQGMKTYMPGCKDFRAARLTRLGVTFDEGQNRCKVTRADQVETLFKAWRGPFRKPVGDMRRFEE